MIIVNSIYAISWTWSWPHVLEKIQEIIAPPVTNGDSLPAILLVSGIVFSATTVKYAVVDAPFWRFAQSMTQRLSPRGLLSQATAAALVATLEVIGLSNQVRPAFAAAVPSRARILIRPGETKHVQPSEYTTGEIFDAVVDYWFVCEEGQLRSIIHDVNSPFVTLTTPRDDLTHRRGNLFSAHIIAHLGWNQLAEVTA